MDFKLKRACNNCPFRKEVNMHLTPSRAEEIASVVLHEDKTFTCHKNLGGSKDKEQHCVGALLSIEKSGKSNSMVQIAERLGLYQPSSIIRDADVFSSVAEMREHYFEPSLGMQKPSHR